MPAHLAPAVDPARTPTDIVAGNAAVRLVPGRVAGTPISAAE